MKEGNDDSRYSPDKFVNREQEIRFILEKGRKLAQLSTLDRRTTIFEGQRGIGKSWLLAHLSGELERLEIYIVTLLNLANFAGHEPILAITHLLNQFRNEVLGQPEAISYPPAQISQKLMHDIQSGLEKQLLAVLVDSVYESN